MRTCLRLVSFILLAVPFAAAAACSGTSVATADVDALSPEVGDGSAAKGVSEPQADTVDRPSSTDGEVIDGPAVDATETDGAAPDGAVTADGSVDGGAVSLDASTDATVVLTVRQRVEAYSTALADATCRKAVSCCSAAHLADLTQARR